MVDRKRDKLKAFVQKLILRMKKNKAEGSSNHNSSTTDPTLAAETLGEEVSPGPVPDADPIAPDEGPTAGKRNGSPSGFPPPYGSLPGGATSRHSFPKLGPKDGDKSGATQDRRSSAGNNLHTPDKPADSWNRTSLAKWTEAGPSRSQENQNRDETEDTRGRTREASRNAQDSAASDDDKEAWDKPAQGEASRNLGEVIRPQQEAPPLVCPTLLRSAHPVLIMQP